MLSSAGSSLALDTTRSVALVGGADGSSATWSVTGKEVLQGAQGDGNAIQDVLIWKEAMPVLATASGEVSVLENGAKALSFTAHAGPATALALHPSGDILASVGQDKTVVMYDLTEQKEIARIISDSREYRPLSKHVLRC